MKPLSTTRRMFALANDITVLAHEKGSFFHLCAMAKELDDLCQRYAGPVSDLDRFRTQAKAAVTKGMTDLFDAIVVAEQARRSGEEGA